MLFIFSYIYDEDKKIFKLIFSFFIIWFNFRTRDNIISNNFKYWKKLYTNQDIIKNKFDEKDLKIMKEVYNNIKEIIGKIVILENSNFKKLKRK